jgi:hypothetical protein
LISGGADRQLCRINVLNFAVQQGLDEEKVIGGFLHVARLGLFDLTWNVLCPGCTRRCTDAQVRAQVRALRNQL